MSIRRTPVLVAAALVASSALPATAAVVVPLSVKDKVALAEVVVRARVEAKEARWVRGRIFTFVQLATTRVIEGRVKVGQPVTVAIPGGEVGDLGQWVCGTPSVELGDDVVVFLAPRPVGWVVVGLGLGWLRPRGAPDGRIWAERTDHPDLGPGVRVSLEEVARTVESQAR